HRARRSERVRQDDVARDTARPPAAGGRDRAARTRGRGCVLLAARGRARRARLRPPVHAGGDGSLAAGGAVAARPFPLLGLGRAREAGRRAVRRKAATPAKPKGPSELERIEVQIAAREHEVAELESKLADDWSDVDTLAAHRRAREELKSLLGRWEELFEKAQA